ncbi:acyl-CoA dehydrogenase [Hephaestia caeni]|uniref:Acyl-CoA dehydrogenase n=1 Tax=Hephaestia caeni TaxID=645617 RepID=A0A397PE62_9SPHN|nr:acyl-CoA dehydrogenase [Hephaestia caeni]RIA45505.1 acyl-CoA dehydrogenase [Hephaestia caeni]
MRELIDPFKRLLDEHCPPVMVREIERGADWRPAWSAIAESGFLDALVPEEMSGFGLSLTDVAPLIEAVGASAMPLPVADTMIARALLARAGQTVPDGPVVLSTGSFPTLFAVVADHFLTGDPGNLQLIPMTEAASAIPGTLDRMLACPNTGLRGIAATLRSQLIAGAVSRVLDLSIAYANDRQQFGKPIGRQQAVQQQLAVLAELAVSARICAAIGMRAGLAPSLRAAATAKIGTGIAAERVASIAHAIHGAIGISEEFDLQLLTRRLYAWRLADGSEGYWAGQLGKLVLDDRPVSALSFALAE